MTARDERGSITVMSIGFLLLLGTLTVVVVNASAAFLQRQELNNLADGAALARGMGLLPPQGSAAEKAMFSAFNAFTKARGAVSDVLSR